jgi:hypothetical protein
MCRFDGSLQGSAFQNPKVQCMPVLGYLYLYLLPVNLIARCCTCLLNTVRSETNCTFRLRYVDLDVSIEVAVEVCCYFTVFSC